MTPHRPSVVALEDTSAGRRQAAAVEGALLQLWEENDLERLDLDSEVDTATLGDGAFKVTWDDREQRVVVSAPDVQGLFVWWLGDDVRRIWRVASRYDVAAAEAEARSGRLPRGPGGRNPQTVTRTEVWTAERFELWVQDELVEARAKPVRRDPVRDLPEHAAPEAVLGRLRHRAAARVDHRAEPRAHPAQPHSRAVGQPDRGARERRGVARHRGSSRARSGSCPKRRAPTCSTCCRAAGCGCTAITSTWSTVRCMTCGDAAHRVRGRRRRPLGRGSAPRAGPAAQEGRAQAPDPLGGAAGSATA